MYPPPSSGPPSSGPPPPGPPPSGPPPSGPAPGPPASPRPPATPEPTTPLPASPVPGPAVGPAQAASPPQQIPSFQPGVASPTYAQPPQSYPPTTAFPGYQPTRQAPPARSGRGSNTLLWVLIVVFSLLLCSGAGVAGVLLYRNGERSAGGQPTPGPTEAVRETEPPENPTTAPTARDAATTITYEVTGDGPASINYFKGGKSGSKRINSAQLPWRIDLPAPENMVGVSVVATRKSRGEGSISCRVLVDGDEVVTRTASGRYATVACIDFLFD